jgi:MFS transporter, DHA1 family, multidrug resistance protein
MSSLAESFNKTYLALFREYPFLIRAALVVAISQVAFALLNVYALPRYMELVLDLNGKMLGAAISTFLLAEALLKYPLGHLSDRFGRKIFIVLGPLFICLNPIAIVALPRTLWLLIFPLRAADGAGAAALWPPLFAMVGDKVRDRSRAVAMSFMNLVYVAAIGGAVIIGSYITHFTGSAYFPFYVAAGLLLISAVVAHFGLAKDAPKDLAAHSEESLAAHLKEELAVAKQTTYPLPLVLLISFLMSLGVLMLANFLVLYFTIDLKLSPYQIAPLMIGLALPVLLLGIPLGHAADRWGTSLAVRISLTLSAAIMWFFPSCHNVYLFAVVAVLLVSSHILGTPAWLALVSQLAPTSKRGAVMGLVATAEGIGAVLGPITGGFLWDKGHYHIFYGSAATLTLAALVALYTLRRNNARRPEESEEVDGGEPGETPGEPSKPALPPI